MTNIDEKAKIHFLNNWSQYSRKFDARENNTISLQLN